MTKIKKQLVIGSVGIFFIAVLLLLLCFRPFFCSAAGVKKLDDGLYTINYTTDYALEAFLTQGGAASDMAVADFAVKKLSGGLFPLDLQGAKFGCSTLSVAAADGSRLFGRNFDWQRCTALIVETKPKGGYASVSTVNMDFLDLGLSLPEETFVRLVSAVSPYAPMDGMNEKGLCVAVLMIEDSPAFAQDTAKPDLTTTTAVRLLLDKAATVAEALELLSQYDLHASAGMMVHFALADSAGRSVVVEYIHNRMTVTETPVVTNFYLTPGDKYGVGSTESRLRYTMLSERLAQNALFTMDQVRDALGSVSKRNFNSVFASTEWSIVYNQHSGEVRYYHRENYQKPYTWFVRSKTAVEVPSAASQPSVDFLGE